MMNLPLAINADRVFLKLNPPEFPYLVENEAFFLDAAKSCGIRTAKATLTRDVTGTAGLLVERFDRVPLGDSMMRLPCEDACQVFGLFPADKYRIDQVTLFDHLGGLTGAPTVARAELFRRFIFVVVSGNGDAHGKNYSVLHVDGEWGLSPTYDVPCTHPYGDSTLALKVDGYRLGQLSRRQALEIGNRLGVRERAAISIVDDVVERFTPWADRLERLPFDQNTLARLRRFLVARLRLLKTAG